jgi:hypothetical protein
VVFFPPSQFFWKLPFPRKNPPDDPDINMAFLVQNGRAVFWPVYKGSFERWDQELPETSWTADSLQTIQDYQDLARSVDYLQERKDIDPEKLAFYTVSTTPSGIINVALEDRFKAAVLAYYGLPPYRHWQPEHDPINFAPRVHVPVLMINSANDPVLPLETSQKPLYQLLGTPLKDKRHHPYDTPNHGVPLEMFKGVMLSWLDQYLGKVR